MRRRLLHVAVLSGLGLFVELLLIRWLDAQIRPLAYVKNLALIASFLGLGIGFALSRSSRSVYPAAIVLLAITLSVGSVFSALPEKAVSGPASPESNLGVEVAVAGRDLAAFYGLIALVFGLVTLTTVPLGQIAGTFMEDLPCLWSYSANVAGALGGILLFSAAAALMVPPWIGALVAFTVALVYLRSRWWFRLASGLVAGCAVAGMVLADHRPDRSTYWSPYNKIDLTRMLPRSDIDESKVPPAWEIRVQNLYYQHIVDLRRETLGAVALAYPFAERAAFSYDSPYEYKRPRRVLVVGAGTGNDVAAALRHDVEEVVAVEIDPLILDLGRRLHPERPYQDPRVRVVIDDARAYLKRRGPSFDLIVFGLLDAHSGLFSTLSSSIRLDNYVYTVEALREAFSRLAADGVFYMSVYVEQPWTGSRLEAMLTEAWGAAPLRVPGYLDGHVYLAGPGLADPEAGTAMAPSAYPSGPNATDDWPFLYLRDRVVPPTVIAASIGASFVGALLVVVFFRGRARFDRHLFFLGAGFLLLETRTIAQLGLLYGATWQVSAITIGGILAVILAANVLVERFGSPSRMALYSMLGFLLLANYAVPTGAALGGGPLAFAAMTGFLLSPLFVAGLIFASSLRERQDLAPVLASNLVGSVLGGMLENLSMVFGISALSLFALTLYAASFKR